MIQTGPDDDLYFSIFGGDYCRFEFSWGAWLSAADFIKNGSNYRLLPSCLDSFD